MGGQVREKGISDNSTGNLGLAERLNYGAVFPQGSKRLLNGKGGPTESRPIVKSEFCQIPPNRLQLIDRILLAWSICLSAIGQSVVFDESAESFGIGAHPECAFLKLN